MELNVIKTNALADTETRSSNDDVMAEIKATSAAQSGSKASDMKAAATASIYSCSRPAWSLSEDATVAGLEEKEVDDEEALLSFAKDLDFDRCMGDMEEQGVMERLSLRIRAMEREAVLEEQRDDESHRRAEKKMDFLSTVLLTPV